MAQFALIRSLLRKKVSNPFPLSTLISQNLNPYVKPNYSTPLLFSYNLSLISFPRFSSISNKPVTNKDICNKISIKKKVKKEKNKPAKKKMKSCIDFTKIPANLLPTVIIVGRPNVGKSALFNRLIGRREALVYNTPNDHVTRDIREGVAKLGDLRFKVLDSAGLETEAASGTILSRTTEMTANVLARTQFAIFLIDVRDGLQPLDRDVGKWMRKHASGIRTIMAMNKSESLDERGLLDAEAGEAYALGFGDPIAISAETGFGMVELYEALQPLLEEYVLQLPTVKKFSRENMEDDFLAEVSIINRLRHKHLVCLNGMVIQK